MCWWCINRLFVSPLPFPLSVPIPLFLSYWIIYPPIFPLALIVCRSADGWLQRVVILGSEAHVIEEIQLFDRQQPVDSLTISHSKVISDLFSHWANLFEPSSPAWLALTGFVQTEKENSALITENNWLACIVFLHLFPNLSHSFSTEVFVHWLTLWGSSAALGKLQPVPFTARLPAVPRPVLRLGQRGTRVCPHRPPPRVNSSIF